MQSSEALMAEQATGAVPSEPGVPGGGSAPRMPGQLGDLQRRFGL